MADQITLELHNKAQAWGVGAYISPSSAMLADCVPATMM